MPCVVGVYLKTSAKELLSWLFKLKRYRPSLNNKVNNVGLSFQSPLLCPPFNTKYIGKPGLGDVSSQSLEFIAKEIVPSNQKAENQTLANRSVSRKVGQTTPF